MNDNLETRMSLTEQRITQVENWIKDLSTKVDRIDDGVNNHLTETARELGEIRLEIVKAKSANAKYAVTILVGIVVSMAVVILKG